MDRVDCAHAGDAARNPRRTSARAGVTKVLGSSFMIAIPKAIKGFS
jgi:hypothetical protein